MAKQRKLAAGIDNQELVSSLMSIISAGFDIKKEPYVQGILAAIRCFLLKVRGFLIDS